MFRKLTFPQVSLLIEYGADPEAKAQKRDISNGEYLTCDQLAQEVGFANYEQVKRDNPKLIRTKGKHLHVIWIKNDLARAVTKVELSKSAVQGVKFSHKREDTFKT